MGKLLLFLRFSHFARSDRRRNSQIGNLAGGGESILEKSANFLHSSFNWHRLSVLMVNIGQTTTVTKSPPGYNIKEFIEKIHEAFRFGKA